MRNRHCHGRLRSQGYRLTFPRQAILDVLFQAKGHLSAEDIYMRVYRICPSCGLTTIYRTLEILVNNGMVTKYQFGDGRCRYELNEKDGVKDHHHHLICKKCKRVIEYTEFMDEELKFLKTVEGALSKKYDFNIKEHDIVFKGFCEKCNASQTA